MNIVKKHMAIILGVLLMANSLTSCFDNSDCANSYSDKVTIRFLKVASDGSIVATPLELDRVRALNAKQFLFEKTGTQLPASEMSFPMNILSDTTTFIFEQTEKTDTILAIFNRKPILINPECGLTQIIDVNTVFTTFDSARVVNRGLRYNRSTSQNSHNLEIYF